MPFGCFSFAVSDSVLTGNEVQPLSKVQMPARMDFSIWTAAEFELTLCFLMLVVDGTLDALTGACEASEVPTALRFTERMNKTAFRKLVKNIKVNGLKDKVIKYVKIGENNYIVYG